MSMQQLNLLHNMVVRAMRAAGQADRLCMAAATAFNLDVRNLRAAGDALPGFMSG